MSQRTAVPPREALRVAFVAGTLRVGGAEKQLFYMSQTLADAGVRVAVVSLGAADEAYAHRLRAANIPVWSVGDSRWRAVRLWRLIRRLRRFNPDIIQASHFYVGLYAVIAGWILRRPAVGALRSDLTHEMRGNPFWGRWLFRLPDMFVANSGVAITNAVRLGRNPATVKLVPNAIAVGGAIPALARTSPSQDRVVAVIVANLLPVKRIDRFIDALAIARAQCPNLSGLIVGDGPLAASLAAQAAERGLDETALVFAGHRDDVPEILVTADFLCLTSAEEGFPNVLLEAMVSGLPVIATPVGAVPAVIEDGVNGYVVSTADAPAIADRMVALAASSALRSRMGQAGRDRVEREYRSDRLAGRLIDVYRQLAEVVQDRRLSQRVRAVDAAPLPPPPR